MLKLYRLSVYVENDLQGNYFVIAMDPTAAVSRLAVKWDDWDYLSMYVKNIQLVATEGQYGEPEVLLFAAN